MYAIPQATYAAKLAERGVGAGTDSAVRTGTIETIDAILVAAANKPTRDDHDPDKITASSPSRYFDQERV